MNLLVIVLVIFLLFGGGWGWHESGYIGGPYLGGGVGLVGVIVVIVLLLR